MMKTAIFVACLLALQTIPVRSQEDDNDLSNRAVDICSILAAPEKYDGLAITVAGTYRVVIHGAVLTGTGCSGTYSSIREAADYRTDGRTALIVKRLLKKDKFQAISVLMKGTFRIAKKGQCFGGDLCSRYEIEVTELIAVKAAAPTSRTPSGLFPQEALSHEALHARDRSNPRMTDRSRQRPAATSVGCV